MKTRLTILLLLSVIFLNAQDYQSLHNTYDVKHYKLTLSVNDTTDVIDAVMETTVRFKKSTPTFTLNLVAFDSITGKGMKVVDSIKQNNINTTFKHNNNQLIIDTKHVFPRVDYTFTIKYKGIPKDGLIISNNEFNERTFFADNWPNRAQNWFPCVDHPLDKATIEYLITAPNHYQVIANGLQYEETNTSNQNKLYHYITNVPIPTKVMVIGIAKFAVQNSTSTNFNISNWVFPQNKTEGFSTFNKTKNILDFFTKKIGDYPFVKLANVQSKTRFGGMENASAIFYAEDAVAKNKNVDKLIAHEIAHQWFGNTVTESDWSHLWLSEGFATYFANLYLKEVEGDSIFKENLLRDKKMILAFEKNNPSPVVNTSEKNYMKLLNPNSYQKGGFVLHMLHNQLGDEVFWKVITNFYDTFKYKNASTNDFLRVVNATSGKNYTTFFKQWLYKKKHPKLKTSWIINKNEVRLLVTQEQKELFEFPLEIELINDDGTSEIKIIEVNTQANPFKLTSSGNVKKVVVDPNTKLLFEIVE
ncbi:MAG TPA: M1 family metallopeptidase [Flavobacteriaceae bacterium]|nr:M1 family metallopeptidase [Flavobacteriaceae bacterium]